MASSVVYWVPVILVYLGVQLVSSKVIRLRRWLYWFHMRFLGRYMGFVGGSIDLLVGYG